LGSNLAPQVIEFETKHNQISGANELTVLAADMFVATGCPCTNHFKETILVESHKRYLHRWSSILSHSKTGWVGYSDLIFSSSWFV